MSMRRANKRDENEPEIFSALRQLGASVYPLHEPCDAVLGYRNKTYLIEVKTPTGKSTKPQAKFIETWRGQYKILRSVDEAVTWLNDVGQGN
tara:strand:+ start:5578 stop:5853 length:276 start_codon:yes stop_codon:yes gene_type:complete